MARRRRKGLRGVYRNPAAAVGLCIEKGLCSKGELYSCAIGLMPQSAPPTWAKNARRLVEEHASTGLCGARSRRRRRR